MGFNCGLLLYVTSAHLIRSRFAQLVLYIFKSTIRIHLPALLGNEQNTRRVLLIRCPVVVGSALRADLAVARTEQWL